MDYNVMWMNPNDIMMGDGGGVSAPMSTDMMSLNQTPQMDSAYFPMSVPPPFESVSQPPLELDGFLMMDELGEQYDEPPRFLPASAAQTNARRKILPVKHPGLKLQSPISYKSGTDPNVIPIHKDGMAVCVKCGAIGVKHAYYTKSRNFCSRECARGESLPNDEDPQREIEFKYPTDVVIKDEEMITKEIQPMPIFKLSEGSEMDEVNIASFNHVTHVASFPVRLELTEEEKPEVLSSHVKYELSQSYDWKPKLCTSHFVAAPVNLFKHAPMADCWEDLTECMKVEVENEASKRGISFWVASVLRINGYLAQLRFDGLDQTRDFWVNLCKSKIHAVGWCAIRGKPLIPPSSISHNCRDWKDFLVRSLTGARTLPMNFSQKVHESLKSRFRLGLQLEVIDREKIGQMRVATIKAIVGKRLHMAYYSSESDDPGFWCHEDSPLIHPVGWSLRVGHHIDAPSAYKARCKSGVLEKDDADEELFTAPFQFATDWKTQEVFKEEMKLEAIDPLNLSAISAATVMKILKDGYLMIRIDGYPEKPDGSDWFCYHSNSPCLFPAGFCKENNIRLVPPHDCNPENFSWDELVEKTRCVLAPPSLFKKEDVNHGFVVGMSLECTDVMDPRLVCVATITEVAGRLLKIHFDGWEEDYDQWMDCCSPDIYPVGWCNLVSHKLEAPKSLLKPGEKAEKTKKKAGRKKRKLPNLKGANAKKDTPLSVDEHDSGNRTNFNERENPQTESSTETLLGIQSNSQDVPMHPPEVEEKMDTSDVTPSPPKKNETYIPRLSDGVMDGDLNPSQWTSEEVATFLNINDFAVYASTFLAQGTSGAKLLSMTQQQIMQLTGKMGPALKIFVLIQQLNQKLKTNKFARR